MAKWRWEKNREAIAWAMQNLIMPDIRDVAAYAGVTEATARDHLRDLIEEGRVHRERVQRWEGGTQRYYYFLKKDSPDAGV